MPVILTDSDGDTIEAIDQSTIVVNVAFKSESGNAVEPKTVTWTLTDDDATVVNSREDVSETPATSVDIVLYGDDLDVDADAVRILTVEATYDSVLGSDLPLRESARFVVRNLKAVS